VSELDEVTHSNARYVCLEKSKALVTERKLNAYLQDLARRRADCDEGIERLHKYKSEHWTTLQNLALRVRADRRHLADVQATLTSLQRDFSTEIRAEQNSHLKELASTMEAYSRWFEDVRKSSIIDWLTVVKVRCARLHEDEQREALTWFAKAQKKVQGITREYTGQVLNDVVEQLYQDLSSQEWTGRLLEPRPISPLEVLATQARLAGRFTEQIGDYQRALRSAWHWPELETLKRNLDRVRASSS
jgi:hypothetical protein